MYSKFHLFLAGYIAKKRLKFIFFPLGVGKRGHGDGERERGLRRVDERASFWCVPEQSKG